MATPASAAPQHAQLKIELAWTQPLIWRRVLVPHSIKMHRLHDVIQIAFDWDDVHLHDFQKDRLRIGPKPPADFDIPYFDEPTPEDERKVRLSDVLTRPRSKLRYVYDFGDDWLHEIMLEKLLPSDGGIALGKTQARCINGANAPAPEDCGGPPGFERFKAAMADRTHPEHADMMDWYAEPFDATHFDLGAVNDRLAPLRC